MVKCLELIIQNIPNSQLNEVKILNEISNNVIEKRSMILKAGSFIVDASLLLVS